MEVKYRHDTHVHNTTAAEQVVPIIMDMVKPASVIDVGCGIGTWLSVFKKAGVQEIMGVDGAYVDRTIFHIREEQFIAADLIQPFRYNKKFDLVVSLEVAEHLPESVADTFVETLVSLGNTILFSAAVPGQGGQNHLNEQWPDYWQTKFARRGYQFQDVIREKIWWNEKVDVWYRQNMFLVSNQSTSQQPIILPVIHPDLYQLHLRNFQQMLTQYEGRIADFERGEVGVKIGYDVLSKAVKRKLIINGK